MRSITLTISRRSWSWAPVAAALVTTAATSASAVEAPGGHAITVGPAASPSPPVGAVATLAFRAKIPPGFLSDIALDRAGAVIVAWEDGATASVSATGQVSEAIRGEQTFSRGPVALTPSRQALVGSGAGGGAKSGVWLRTATPSGAVVTPAPLPHRLVKSTRRRIDQAIVAPDGAGGAWLSSPGGWAHWTADGGGGLLADGELEHETSAVLPLPPARGGALFLGVDGASVVGGPQTTILRWPHGVLCAPSGDSAPLSTTRLLVGCTNGTILVADTAALTLKLALLPTALGSLVALDDGTAAFVDSTGILTFVEHDGSARSPSPDGAGVSVGARAALVPLPGARLATVTREGELSVVDPNGQAVASASERACEGVVASVYDARSARLVLLCQDGAIASFVMKAP